MNASYLNTLLKKFYKILNISIFYSIELDNYYFHDKKRTYILAFRLKNKSLGHSLTVQNAFFDKAFLNQLHPLDAFKVGAIFGMQRNNVFFQQVDHTTNIPNKTSNKRIQIQPILKIKRILLQDSVNEIILTLNKNDHEFKVNLEDIHSKQFLLYGLPPISAATIGLIVSEYFIKKFNFK